jgi:hypothetical protein
LLVILPFSGIRVICFGGPEDAGAASAPAHEAQTGTDCERLCALHRPDAKSDTGSGPHCALTADPSCFNFFAHIAVVSPQQPLLVSLVAAPVVATAPQLYPEPALALLGPPPKSSVL